MPADKGPYPYAIVMTKNPSWSRSSHFRRRVNFNSIEHARNYCKKVVKPDWWQPSPGQWRNRNHIVKITVWTEPGVGFVWTKNTGWINPEKERIS